MGVHRHVFGDMDEIQVTVRETVTVKPGDLMFINDTALDVGATLDGARLTVDNFAYPWAAGATVAAMVGHSGNSPQGSFIGVAMEDSAKTTTTISVATRGIFRFPLATKGAVTIGAVVSGMAPSSFSVDNSTTASYQVQTATSAASIGYCIKTESGASNVDFRIRTVLGEGLVS